MKTFSRAVIYLLLIFLSRHVYSQSGTLNGIKNTQEFKRIERKSLKKTIRFYKSIYSELPTDAMVLIVPVINISKNTSDEFQFSLAKQKFAPLVIVSQIKSSNYSIVNLIDNTSFHLPNASDCNSIADKNDEISSVQQSCKILTFFKSDQIDHLYQFDEKSNYFIGVLKDDIIVFDLQTQSLITLENFFKENQDMAK